MTLFLSRLRRSAHGSGGHGVDASDDSASDHSASDHSTSDDSDDDEFTPPDGGGEDDESDDDDGGELVDSAEEDSESEVEKEVETLIKHERKDEETFFYVRYQAPYDSDSDCDWENELDLDEELVAAYWEQLKQEQNDHQKEASDRLRSQKMPTGVVRVVGVGSIRMDDLRTPPKVNLSEPVSPPSDRASTPMSQVTRAAMLKMLHDGRAMGNFSVTEAVAHATEVALNAFHTVDRNAPHSWYSRKETIDKIMLVAPEVVEMLREPYRAGHTAARGKEATEAGKIRFDITSNLHHLGAGGTCADKLKGFFVKVEGDELPAATHRSRIGYRARSNAKKEVEYCLLSITGSPDGGGASGSSGSGIGGGGGSRSAGKRKASTQGSQQRPKAARRPGEAGSSTD